LHVGDIGDAAALASGLTPPPPWFFSDTNGFEVAAALPLECGLFPFCVSAVGAGKQRVGDTQKRLRRWTRLGMLAQSLHR
jgi:hypothetical protein